MRNMQRLHDWEFQAAKEKDLSIWPNKCETLSDTGTTIQQHIHAHMLNKRFRTKMAMITGSNCEKHLILQLFIDARLH